MDVTSLLEELVSVREQTEQYRLKLIEEHRKLAHLARELKKARDDIGRLESLLAAVERP